MRRAWMILAMSVLVINLAGVAARNTAEAAAKSGGKPQAKIPNKHPAPPDKARAESMVKVTLVTLNNAVLTKNFSVLRSQSSHAFRRKYSAASLRRAFAPFIKQGVDLAPALNLALVWSAAPRVDAHGELRLLGWFRTQPRIVRFDLRYLRERGRWRLSMIDVDTTQTAKE